MISAVGGFIMKSKSVESERRYKLAEIREKAYASSISLQIESADAAAARVGDFGKVTRRTIGLWIVFSFVGILALAAYLNVPTVVESTKESNGFLGLIGGGSKKVYTEVTGFFLAPEYRVAFLSIVSFYFGQAAGKAR